MRHEHIEQGAKCLQEIANFSQVLFSPIPHRVAKTKEVPSKSYFIMFRTCACDCMPWSGLYEVNFCCWNPTILFTTCSNGEHYFCNWGSGIIASDILEEMLVYIEPSLSLYFFFCIWGFGTVALMGDKSCYSTSLNFPPGHLKANMGKVFPQLSFLNSKENPGWSCFESDNCFQIFHPMWERGWGVNLGKAVRVFAAHKPLDNIFNDIRFQHSYSIISRCANNPLNNIFQLSFLFSFQFFTFW